MTEDRITQAMARIEAAAQRVEAAIAAQAIVTSAETAELRQRYDALRAEAGTALADIDRLIGKLDR